MEIQSKVLTRLTRCRVEGRALRWICEPASFDFTSTRDVNPGRAFLGQRKALEALRMGFEMTSPGYNLFLCGLTGNGKMQLVEQFARRYAHHRADAPDRCYVQNFSDVRRPCLLEVPGGKGSRIELDVSALVGRLQVELEKVPERNWRSCARNLLDVRMPALIKRHPFPAVRAWLEQWRKRFLRLLPGVLIEDFELNCLGQPAFGKGPHIVSETNPTHANLFGWIGRRSVAEGPPRPHFTEIRRGAFLEADGGVLILDAADLLQSPGSWTTLSNCLKYGTLEIMDGDPSSPARTGTIKPQPIPLSVKVVLVGDYPLYDYLFENDPDFQDVFKIRIDFSSETRLTSKVLRRDVPALVSSVCESERLLPLAPSAVARVAEYGVRRAGRQNKISTQTGVYEDVLREADYWARQEGRRKVTAGHVERAIDEAIERVNLVEKKISEMIADGTILIATSGARVGQVNGLAIYDMGDYFFGKPSRITAETSVGQGGIINIERESGFSGRSHDKGVQILCGYLRSCFAQSRPMSLTASVCFEQSYSGIDGDSASTTEIFAILSSLSGLPIRQDIAVTGSLSQKGDVQPIGGVNEKIEGFFDCVQVGKPTGHEGVIIPRKNLADLMLRKDVVAAVGAGRFHIYAIDTVEEGIEILTGVEAGRRRKNGSYAEGTVFHEVDRRLEELAENLRKYEE